MLPPHGMTTTQKQDKQTKKKTPVIASERWVTEDLDCINYSGTYFLYEL